MERWRGTEVPLPALVGGCVAVVAAAGVGAVMARTGRHAADLRLVPVAAAGALLVAAVVALHRARWTMRLAAVAAGLAAAAAGGAMGSAGWPELAVAATIPLAWVTAVDDGVGAAAAPAVAALVAGVVAAEASGRARAGAVAGAVVAAGVAAAAVWVGRFLAGQLEVLRRERTELVRVRTEMVTTVSHELRTPLTVIQGATATLARRWDVLSEPERLDLVDVLTENVSSLDASIVHFIDASRLERGELIIEPGWVDMGAAVAAAVTRRSAVLAGHEIRTDIGAEWVWADRTAVERMVEHLLMNAARFSAMGMPIGLRTIGGAGEVTISVTDHGQGIPAHLLGTVWEPLQRGDVAETGVSRGAGLGLPIVRELARLHGGDASLRSSRGRGTTVWVTLPLPAEAPPPPARSGAPAPSGRVPLLRTGPVVGAAAEGVAAEPVVATAPEGVVAGPVVGVEDAPLSGPAPEPGPAPLSGPAPGPSPEPGPELGREAAPVVPGEAGGGDVAPALPSEADGPSAEAAAEPHQVGAVPPTHGALSRRSG